MNNLFPEIDESIELDDMNIVEEETPQPAENPQPTAEQPTSYDFVTGDLDSFMNDFAQPKENMGIDTLPTSEEFAETDQTTVPAATARKTGKFIANMVDYSLATGLSLISGLPTSNHQADNDSKKELESIITEYIKENGGEIPIGMQLFICLAVTYGLQIPGAIKMRNSTK